MFKVSNIFKLLYYFTFILSFWNMFVVFFVPNTNANIYVCCILWVILFFYGIIFKFNRLKKLVLSLISLRVVHYLLAFCIFLYLTSFVHMLQGSYIMPFSYYFMKFKQFIIATTIMFSLPFFSIFFNIKAKNVIKIFFISIYTVLLIAIIQLFFWCLNIAPINAIFDFITNARPLIYQSPEHCRELLRTYSVFSEPSELGQFIFIIMPFLYTFSRSKKYNIFNNKKLDFSLKKISMPLLFIVLITTQSPIYLLFCTTEYLILFSRNRKKIFWYSLFALLIILSLVVLTFNTSILEFINSTYLKRIIDVFKSLTSIEGIVQTEQSLATRIISYYLQIRIFLENFFFGTGYYNLECYLNKLIFKVNTPLTQENVFFIYAHPAMVGVNRSVVYSLLADCGIIGFILYVSFIIKTYINTSKLKLIFNDNLYSPFLESLRQAIIAISVLSFYNLHIVSTFVWIILGLSPLLQYTLKIYGRSINNDEKN